ncbi:endonuclease MutS2 [Halobacillus fulvus]|nr:endonuclease MutS2 [Halobacillus fulvus]
MNQRTFETLEYNEILNTVSEFALTKEGKETIRQWKPINNKKQLVHQQNELKEAIAILNQSGSVPIHTLDDVSAMLEQGKKGMFIRPQQFSDLISFLEHCTKLKRFMKQKEFVAPMIFAYAWSIADLTNLEEEVASTIRYGQIDDQASKELARTRKQIRIIEGRIKEKLESLARKYKTLMQESHPVLKNERYTLPIRRENRRKVKGTVVDQSSSGATVFIEPEAMTSLQEELYLLKVSEETEMENILYTLTGEVLAHEQELNLAIETMHHYDILFAKAKYSRSIRGSEPAFSNDFSIRLLKARHPLLMEEAVPLTVELGADDQALLITGPNTGGKTVTLKTVGLLALMAQTGLHIPADPGSELPIFQHVFVDIGDGQSIEQNLSTFSSRLVNLINILREANDHSLLLLDEIGSGTDPGEGMGLATAILDQLATKGSTIFATTHYSEMKQYAEEKPGFLNGAMEFDLDTLKPTYRLQIGETGKSQAFAVAHKLGLHPDILSHAHEVTYRKPKSFSIKEEELKKEDYWRQVTTNRYGRQKSEGQKSESKVQLFQMGDNVTIPSEDEIGIIYTGPDEKGNYRVQVKGEKRTYNHKRLKLYISRDELYPDDYDFDIIFKSKDYRKVKKQLDRKHVEGLMLDDEE